MGNGIKRVFRNYSPHPRGEESYGCHHRPYPIARNPGCAGMILFYGCMPFIVCSLYGLIPALLLAAAFIFCTYFEYRMLYKELPGYKEYTIEGKVPLVPFIW